MKQKFLIGLAILIVVVLSAYIFYRRPAQEPLAQNAVTKVNTNSTGTVMIPVEGMSCMACAASVKKGLKNVQGVTEVEVSLEGRNAKVSYQTGRVDPELLAKTINQLGYKAGSPVAENPK